MPMIFLSQKQLRKPEKISEDQRCGFVYSDMKFFGAENGCFEGRSFQVKALREGIYIHNAH
jgi:hypothetical protein